MLANRSCGSNALGTRQEANLILEFSKFSSGVQIYSKNPKISPNLFLSSKLSSEVLWSWRILVLETSVMLANRSCGSNAIGSTRQYANVTRRSQTANTYCTTRETDEEKRLFCRPLQRRCSERPATPGKHRGVIQARITARSAPDVLLIRGLISTRLIGISRPSRADRVQSCRFVRIPVNKHT